jgi:hypothetical protein
LGLLSRCDSLFGLLCRFFPIIKSFIWGWQAQLRHW